MRHPTRHPIPATLLPALLVALLLSRPATAQTSAAKFTDSARTEIDHAVLTGDTARLTRTVGLLNRALVAYPSDGHLLHYRGYAKYRQAIEQFKANNVRGALPFIERGISDLMASSSTLPWPETFALLGSMHAFRILVDSSLRASLSAGLDAFNARASQLGPNNPRVLLLQAQSAYRAPVESGGGADRAKALLERAMQAFETDKPATLAPSWGREEALALQRALSPAR